MAPTFKPATIVGNLIRRHKRARRALFTPGGAKDRPLPVEDAASRRTTSVRFEDGREESATGVGSVLDGEDRIPVAMARRWTGKQSTQEVSLPAKKPHLKAQPSADIGQDDYSGSVKEK